MSQPPAEQHHRLTGAARAIEVHDLTVAYDRRPVLWSIEADVPKGRLAAIIGPNGAGKSTLLKAMVGLVSVASGYVRIFDKSFREVRRSVAYVPQRESVDWDFPATVADVVLMGRYAQRSWWLRPSKADRDLVRQSLEQVGMADFRDRQIGQLSGGQQQRVFLARALAQQAELYLMDEPFAGVDAATEARIVELLHQMRDAGKTVVVVHHDLQTAARYFDWALLLNLRLVASGPAETVLTPQLLSETYGGKLNLLHDLSHQIAQERMPTRDPTHGRLE